jgi:hypothetical protein
MSAGCQQNGARGSAEGVYGSGMARVVCALVLAMLVTSASAASVERPRFGVRASPLVVREARVPSLGVRHIVTSGVYPEVSGGDIDLRAVNATLREAVLSDERSFRPYARSERRTLERDHMNVHATSRGRYLMWVDRRLVSASTAVVSVLLPETAEAFEGQEGGDTWLSMTVAVPSGRRLTLRDLFAHVDRALPVLQHAWRRSHLCARIYGFLYTPKVSNYRAFALTPTGLAIGVPEVAACYRQLMIVPYRIVDPYLSKLGRRLVAGARQPQRLSGDCFRHPPRQNAPGSWGHVLRCAQRR